MRTDVPLDDVAAVVATVGTTSFASVDPVRELAERARAAGAWLHVDAAYAGSSWICEEERWSQDGVELADSLVVNPHKWLMRADGLLAPLDVAAGRVPAGVLARAGVPAHAGGRVRALGVRPGARPALPLAEALGGAALLRRRGPARDPARAHPARGALRRAGSRPTRTGSSWRRSGSRSSSSAGTAATRRTRRSSSARTAAVRSFSRTRSSTAATCCGWQSATRARPRRTCARAWEVLNR